MQIKTSLSLILIIGFGFSLSSCFFLPSKYEKPLDRLPVKGTISYVIKRGFVGTTERKDYGHFGDLYLMNENGKTMLAECDLIRPNWSPNGSKISFINQGDLYLADTKQMSTELIYSSSNLKITSPATWSPDGKRLVFSAIKFPQKFEVDSYGIKKFADRQPSDIYIVSAVVGEAKSIARNLQIEGIDPVWSPNGQWIVYKSCYKTEFGSYRCQNFIVRTDGSDKRSIGHLTSRQTAAEWIPNSMSIVISSINYSLDGNRSVIPTKALNHLRKPYWNKEREIYAYSWHEYEKGRPTHTMTRIRSKTRDFKRDITHGDHKKAFYHRDYEWSTDAKNLLFICFLPVADIGAIVHEKDRRPKLYLSYDDFKRTALLTKTTEACFYPEWRPEGR